MEIDADSKTIYDAIAKLVERRAAIGESSFGACGRSPRTQRERSGRTRDDALIVREMFPPNNTNGLERTRPFTVYCAFPPVLINRLHPYSYRRASIGFIRAALCVG